MATPYQNVAKAALMNWPPNYSEQEANAIIQTKTVQELEEQIGAMPSMKSAVRGISNQIGLNEEEKSAFYEAVINGPENAEIIGIVSEKIKGFSEEQTLNVLTTIHDIWVLNNANEKTFNKKLSQDKLRQYAPLELIGWNEVLSDLLFLKPILTAVGVQVDEQALAQAYHTRTANYMEEMNINSYEDLTALVQQGRKYYPVLSEELETRLLPLSETISHQIIDNWKGKDTETAQIFANRQQKANSWIK